MTGLPRRVALVTLPAGRDREDGLRRLAADAASGGAVRRASAFVRMTPDTDPFADSFGGRGLVLIDLAADADPSVIGRLAEGAGGVVRGPFTRIATLTRRPGDAPDPHGGTGLLVVLLDNVERARDREFNAWYDDVHLADVTGAAGFWGGVRFERQGEGTSGRDETGRFLATYVTDADDVLGQHAAVKAAVPRMTLWPSIAQVHLGAYRRLPGVRARDRQGRRSP